jgi:hypothetical protein
MLLQFGNAGTNRHFLQEVHGCGTEERAHADRASLNSLSGASSWRTRSRTSTTSLGRLLSNRAGSSWLTRSKGSSRCRASTAESSNTGSGAGVGNGSVAGVEDTVAMISLTAYIAEMCENLRIDDMDDTVGNENIGSDDTCAVNEDTAAVDGDGQVLAVQSLEHSSVGQTRAVAWSRSHNRMVGENIGDLLRSKAGKTTANGLECGVVWREDSDVGGSVNGVQEVGGVKGTTE